MMILEDQCCQGYFSVLIVSQSEMSAFSSTYTIAEHTFLRFPLRSWQFRLLFSTIEKKTVPRMKIDFPSL